jgi:hypothetical protein
MSVGVGARGSALCKESWASSTDRCCADWCATGLHAIVGLSNSRPRTPHSVIFPCRGHAFCISARYCTYLYRLRQTCVWAAGMYSEPMVDSHESCTFPCLEHSRFLTTVLVVDTRGINGSPRGTETQTLIYPWGNVFANKTNRCIGKTNYDHLLCVHKANHNLLSPAFEPVQYIVEHRLI